MAIKKGDIVQVHYTGKLADGQEFDSSRDRAPLEFTIGNGMVISGFEKAVEGHEKGDIITADIPPEEAYGHPDPDYVFTVARAQVPDHIPLKVGTPIQLSNEQGQMDAVITEVGPEEITLDANPPLAGKNLIFEIEVIDVKPGTPE